MVEAERTIERISGASSDLFVMGAEAERIKIFAKFRELIDQKTKENDQTAENILGWAYEKLAE